jgi:hypothetical protein
MSAGADKRRSHLRVVKPGGAGGAPATPSYIRSGDLRARQLLADCLADQLAEFMAHVFKECAERGEPLTETQRKIVTAAAMTVLRSERLWRPFEM